MSADAARLITGDNELPIARTEKGVAYDRLRQRIAKMLASKDSKVVEKVLHANEDILRVRDVTPGAVHVDQVLQTMSVQYANDEYIGLRLMPVIPTSGKLSAIYYKYDKRDRLAYPDDDMTARTNANELNEHRSRSTTHLTPRALKEFVDQTTLNNQDAPLNEIIDIQANVLEGLAFKQEKRIATAMTTSGNFGGNVITLAAPDRWDTATGGNPVGDIHASLASMWVGRGPGRRVAACSLNVWNVLKVHPRILDVVRGFQGGGVSREMFAAYFEIDELLVGKARQDTANEGQAASYSRIWPDVFLIARVSNSPSIRNAAFGYTFMDKPGPFSRLWYSNDEGPEGGWWSQANFADSQEVTAGDTGALIATPIG